MMGKCDPSAGSPVDADLSGGWVADGCIAAQSTGTVHVAAQIVGFAAVVVADRGDRHIEHVGRGVEVRHKNDLAIGQLSTGAGLGAGHTSDAGSPGTARSCGG